MMKINSERAETKTRTAFYHSFWINVQMYIHLNWLNYLNDTFSSKNKKSIIVGRISEFKRIKTGIQYLLYRDDRWDEG